MIWHVTRLAINNNLTPIIVVTGCKHKDVEAVVNDLPLIITYNDGWKVGQSSSIRRGLEELPETTQACLFLLSDQPQIPISLVRLIIKRFNEHKSAIIAPRVNGKRGNPVLFDRSTFPELLKLKGNEGGRMIFDKHEVDYIEWDDESILIDVDTEESYQKLLRLQP